MFILRNNINTIFIQAQNIINKKINKEINKELIYKFSNLREIFKSELDNYRQNGEKEIISKISTFEFLFELADTDMDNSNFKKTQAINILTKDENNTINENGREFLINMFSSIIIKIFLDNLNSKNMSQIIISLLKIYEFSPKDTNFIKNEISKIIINLSNIGYIDLSNELQIIIQNLIDPHFVKTEFLNIIENLLMKLLNNDNDKIESVKLILENEDIFSNLIETKLFNIIDHLFNKGLKEGYYKVNLLKFILKNENILNSKLKFYKKIKKEIPQIIENLLMKLSSNDNDKIESVKLILENKDIFSDFIETKLFDIIDHLFNKGLQIYFSKTNLLRLILKDKTILNSKLEFYRKIKKEIPQIIENLLINNLEKDYDRINLLQFILENEDFFKLMETKLLNIIEILLNEKFANNYNKMNLLKLILKNKNIKKDFINSIEKKLIDTIKYLFHEGLQDYNNKIDLLQFILADENILKFMETELPYITKDLFKQNLSNDNKINLLKLISKNEDILKIPSIIEELSKENFKDLIDNFPIIKNQIKSLRMKKLENKLEKFESENEEIKQEIHENNEPIIKSK